MELLNKRMRDLREDNDLTQQQIAVLLKIKKEQYYRYEKGINPFPVRHLVTLANFYNTSADYLLGRTDNPRPIK